MDQEDAADDLLGRGLDVVMHTWTCTSSSCRCCTRPGSRRRSWICSPSWASAARWGALPVAAAENNLFPLRDPRMPESLRLSNYMANERLKTASYGAASSGGPALCSFAVVAWLLFRLWRRCRPTRRSGEARRTRWPPSMPKPRISSTAPKWIDKTKEPFNCPSTRDGSGGQRLPAEAGAPSDVKVDNPYPAGLQAAPAAAAAAPSAPAAPQRQRRPPRRPAPSR